jgi:hypothetical protein
MRCLCRAYGKIKGFCLEEDGMRYYNSDWTLILGEIIIDDEDNNTHYTLVAGYVRVGSGKLYIRLFDSDDKLVFGTWEITSKNNYIHSVPSKILEQCYKYARNMEKLKVFA